MTSDLIAKLEALNGPDREVDHAIAAHFGLYNASTIDGPHLRRRWNGPELTASLDSAIALVGRVLPGWAWTIMAAKPLTTTEAGETVAKGPFTAFVNNSPRRPAEPDAECEGVGTTPAIALLIALLRARSALEARQE